MAVVVDCAPVWSDIFVADRSQALSTNLLEFSVKLDTLWQQFGGIDLVCIEQVSVSFNVNTIRKISYFEAVAMIVAASHGTEVIQIKPSQARKIALGKGSLSKDECYDLILAHVGASNWFWTAPVNAKLKGGSDETDALVCALAGPTLIAKVHADRDAIAEAKRVRGRRPRGSKKHA